MAKNLSRQKELTDFLDNFSDFMDSFEDEIMQEVYYNIAFGTEFPQDLDKGICALNRQKLIYEIVKKYDL